GHVRRKVPSSLLVHAFEVAVLQQPSRARKARSRLLWSTLRSVSVHQLTILKEPQLPLTSSEPPLLLATGIWRLATDVRGKTTRGNPVSPRRACAAWVEMYVSASKIPAPD